MSALVHTGTNALADPLEFSRDQVEIIRNTICPGIKDNELAYCLEVAGRLGANPILKEVHFIFQNVHGGRKVMVQLGIDFYRRRAEETGRLLGKEIEVCDGDGVWHDVLPAGKKLYAARCTLHVEGKTIPIRRTAYWREFGEPNANNPIWRTKSIHMLTKVAESHAIRDMCAGQLGGTVTEDEVDAGDLVQVTQGKQPPAPARQALAAPKNAPQPETNGEAGSKSPDQAKREVLGVEIKDYIKRIDGQDFAKVRETVARMSNPGPFARTRPDFQKWTTDQLEELVGVYAAIESGEAAEPEQTSEDDAQEAEVSEVKEAPSEPPVITEDQAEADALADELRPKPAETDDNGKPKAPF